MGLVFLIVAGGVLGWLATIMDQAQSLKETPINMLTGIVGALLAGLVISPRLGIGSMVDGEHSVAALLIGVAGALTGVVLAYLWRRRVSR